MTVRLVLAPQLPTPSCTSCLTQPQPAPLEFKGEVNKWYETKRNGHVTRIYLLEIKKDKAIFKDDPSDKHTQSMPLAKFIKFYG
jgi:hypothetical protein